MKRILIISLVIFVLCAGMAVAAEPIKLKFATMDPAQTPPVVQAYKPWVDLINQASEGTLQIEIFPGGSLGRNPTVQLKLVTDGVADMAFVVPSYTPGRFPDDEVFDLPFMALNGLESAIASQRMFKKGLLGGYDDVVVLAHYTTEVYYLHSIYPIKVPGDLKGHKLRAVNQFQSDLLQRFGAVGIGMPSPQIAENMSRGIIEGAMCDNSALFTFRISDVAKHHLLLPLGGTSLAVVMNKQKYESLPPKAKAALNTHGEKIVEMWVKAIQGHIKEGLEKIKADPKHILITPTSAELKKWKETIQPAIDAWAAKNPKRVTLIKAYQEELDRIRAGK